MGLVGHNTPISKLVFILFISIISVSPLDLVELDCLFLSWLFFMFCFESLFYMVPLPLFTCVWAEEPDDGVAAVRQGNRK